MISDNDFDNDDDDDDDDDNDDDDDDHWLDLIILSITVLFMQNIIQGFL